MLAIVIVMFLSVVAGQNGEEIIIKKCCSFGQIYHQGKDSCVSLESRANSTDWLEILPKKRPIDQRLIEGGPKVSQCGPGFEFRHVVFDPNVGNELAVVLGGQMNGVRIKDHPEQPWVDLDHICFDDVQDGDGRLLLARMCFQSPCAEKVCVRKCCAPRLASYDTENEQTCKKTRDPMKVERHHIYTFSAEKVNETLEDKKTHVLIGYPPYCTNYTDSLDPSKDENQAFFVDLDGSLYVPMLRRSFPVHQYCVEKVNDGPHPVAFFCFLSDEQKKTTSNSELTVYASIAILSLVCLIMTFVVYSVLPNLRNLNGKNLLSYVASLFWAYFFLVCIQLRGVAILQASKGLCRVIGLLLHYFFMVAFFWLSVMSFDLWRTFRNMRFESGRNSSTAEKRRFLLFSAYAWGSPLLISSVTITMEFAPGISPFYIKPKFAHNGCWFETKDRAFVYFMGPMALVLLANVVFFIMTTIKLFQIMKQTEALKNLQDNKQHKQNKNRFFLYVKILVVMGVSWILEVISWAVGGPPYIWYLANACNVLQGLFIFLIFVCKKNILRMLNNKYHLIQNKRVLEMLHLESSVNQGSQASNVTNVSTTSPV